MKKPKNETVYFSIKVDSKSIDLAQKKADKLLATLKRIQKLK